VLPARNSVELAIELNAPLRGRTVVALYATLQPFAGGRDGDEGAADQYGEPLGPPVLVGEVTLALTLTLTLTLTLSLTPTLTLTPTPPLTLTLPLTLTR